MRQQNFNSIFSVGGVIRILRSHCNYVLTSAQMIHLTPAEHDQRLSFSSTLHWCELKKNEPTDIYKSFVVATFNSRSYK